MRDLCATRLRSALAAFALVIAGPVLADELPPGVDPVTGYRMENFRAPTPTVLPGGVIVDFDTVKKAAAGQGYQLIDVAGKGAVADPVSGDWSNTDKHQSIPGSVWLPNIGGGELKPEMDAYMWRNLEALTGGDKAKGIIFYCMADCWQSWNAAQRAIRNGYTHVGWYPLGSDGWREQGGDLVALTAVNLHGKSE